LEKIQALQYLLHHWQTATNRMWYCR